MDREAELQLERGWKQMITDGLYHTGLLGAFHGLSHRYELRLDDTHRARLQRVRRAKYVVLGYHRVGVEGIPLYCTLPQKVFAEQMQYVVRHYRVLSVEQMVEELANPNTSGQAVVITFDDGYLGTYTEAFPIIREYKIPVTVYLAAGAVESGEALWYDRIFLQFVKAGPELTVMLNSPRSYKLTTHNRRIEAAAEVVTYLRSLPDDERQNWCRQFEQVVPLRKDDLLGAMMTWEQVRVMQRAGVCFGAHTMTHPVVSRLGPEALGREGTQSKWLIEQRIGVTVEHFAFPFGKVSDCGIGAASVLRKLGFQSALTSIGGVNEPGADLFSLRRRVIGNNTSIARFAFELNRLFFQPAPEEISELTDITAA